MAESTPIQHIQFGDEINPVKTASSRVYSIASKEPSLPEKAAGHDLEEKAVQIANEDLNRKRKQVHVHFLVSGAQFCG